MTDRTAEDYGLPDVADMRRALVLIKHANTDAFNIDGINAVLHEATEAGRISQLIAGTAIAVHTLGALDPDGLDFAIADYAAKENNR